MEANELMIGDWVLTLDSTHKEKVFAQIDAIEEGKHSILVTRGCCNWFVDIDWIEPIPLSPEILEKNGWVIDHIWTDLYTPRWDLMEDIYFPIELCNTHFAFGILNGREFDYVHELQHVLKLLNIDKEIEL